MSYITDVLIIHGREENIDALNAWLTENDDRQQQLCEISMEAAGGTKYFVSDVWAAAFNYMPFDLYERLRDPASWSKCLYSVVVVINGEDAREAFFFNDQGLQRIEDPA